MKASTMARGGDGIKGIGVEVESYLPSESHVILFQLLSNVLWFACSIARVDGV
jgi:hypothetical protein